MMICNLKILVRKQSAAVQNKMPPRPNVSYYIMMHNMHNMLTEFNSVSILPEYVHTTTYSDCHTLVHTSTYRYAQKSIQVIEHGMYNLKYVTVLKWGPAHFSHIGPVL